MTELKAETLAYKNEGKIQQPNYVVTTVYDRKSGEYGMLAVTKNNAVAMRSFIDECSNPKSALNAHPEDYDLVNIGEYNTSTGELFPKKIITLINAAQAKNENK